MSETTSKQPIDPAAEKARRIKAAAQRAAKAEEEAIAREEAEAAAAAAKLLADAKQDAKAAESGLVKVTKGEEAIHIHPTAMAAHKRAGWAPAE